MRCDVYAQVVVLRRGGVQTKRREAVLSERHSQRHSKGMCVACSVLITIDADDERSCCLNAPLRSSRVINWDIRAETGVGQEAEQQKRRANVQHPSHNGRGRAEAPVLVKDFTQKVW